MIIKKSNNRKNKKGDTLIEVTLAVGIFSMVAVAVMAVMNGGAASAQMALEATLAREEVDMQAEALRFIQSAYIAEKSGGESNGKYGELWSEITEKASSVSEDFPPSECSVLYGDDGEAMRGFVINTRKLGMDGARADDVVLTGKGKLRQAVTYPRLVYGDDGDLTGNSNVSLGGAEGIYIIAVKDPGTNIGNDSKSAFYDFYIRTCWYGNRESAPSTIYTLVRLGDPGIGGNNN